MLFVKSSAAAALLLATAVVPAAAQEPGRPVDLELVLAVDASSSVSTAEFELQIQGLARAFRDPRVLQAIDAAGELGLAVSLVQWSGGRKQVLAVDWTLVTGPEGAGAFADELAGVPRFVIGGGTAIGGALQFAMGQLDGNGFRGRRRVIDVSGDGRANQGAQPATLRDRAVALGITINGLAILNEEAAVADYYRAQVIGGAGAFVITANDYEAYALAILDKLLREIGGPLIAARPPGSLIPRSAQMFRTPPDSGTISTASPASAAGASGARTIRQSAWARVASIEESWRLKGRARRRPWASVSSRARR